MKRINWNLISNVTTIISMTAVLIGFIFMANVIHEQNLKIDNLHKRLTSVEVMQQVYSRVHDYYCEIEEY